MATVKGGVGDRRQPLVCVGRAAIASAHVHLLSVMLFSRSYALLLRVAAFEQIEQFLA